MAQPQPRSHYCIRPAIVRKSSIIAKEISPANWIIKLGTDLPALRQATERKIPAIAEIGVTNSPIKTPMDRTEPACPAGGLSRKKIENTEKTDNGI